MFAVLFLAINKPSRSILFAIVATAGFKTLSENISKDNAKSWVVNWVATWNWVVNVTGTEVSLKSSTDKAGPVAPTKRPGRLTLTVAPIFPPTTAN